MYTLFIPRYTVLEVLKISISQYEELGLGIAGGLQKKKRKRNGPLVPLHTEYTKYTS